jgi:hypothetical protein
VGCAGLYTQIALPWHGGTHDRNICRRLIFRRLCEERERKDSHKSYTQLKLLFSDVRRVLMLPFKPGDLDVELHEKSISMSELSESVSEKESIRKKAPPACRPSESRPRQSWGASMSSSQVEHSDGSPRASKWREWSERLSGLRECSEKSVAKSCQQGLPTGVSFVPQRNSEAIHRANRASAPREIELPEADGDDAVATPVPSPHVELDRPPSMSTSTTAEPTSVDVADAAWRRSNI